MQQTLTHPIKSDIVSKPVSLQQKSGHRVYYSTIFGGLKYGSHRESCSIENHVNSVLWVRSMESYLYSSEKYSASFLLQTIILSMWSTHLFEFEFLTHFFWFGSLKFYHDFHAWFDRKFHKGHQNETVDMMVFF